MDPLPSTVDVETEGESSPLAAAEAMGSVSSNMDSNENVFHLDIVPELFASIKGPDWLRQQPDDSYVLQIFSASDIENVRKLLDGIPGISEQLSGYTKYTPSGKPRYLVFYGLYRDKEAAIYAVSEMHPRLKSIEPWPASVKYVLSELDKASGPRR